jgi:hypothetical protein
MRQAWAEGLERQSTDQTAVRYPPEPLVLQPVTGDIGVGDGPSR